MTFAKYVQPNTVFCLHTDNLGLATNLAKFIARHDHWTNDLIIWTYVFAIENTLLLIHSHSFIYNNKETYLLSKNKTN